jgi:multisubunit Na+/H+ antiporter MnhG subunit
MPRALKIIGTVCLIIGGVWFLQGINVLPGSFMTGQTKWAVYGAMSMVVGVGLIMLAKRRPQ